MSPGGVNAPMKEAVETNGPTQIDTGTLKSPPAVEGQWTPESVISTLDNPPTPDSNSPLPFFHLLERLKTTKREGWRRFNINHGESVADHMYRMSIITMLCPPELAARLDLSRCTRMALVHDMAESLVGDITPVDGVSKPEKSRREAETMDYICSTLLGKVHGGAAGEAMRSVWQEYEDDKTPEAHFVHDVDKMELLLQMIEYERSQQGRVDLGEFSWVAKRIKLPEVQTWAEGVLEERRAFWNGLRGKGVSVAMPDGGGTGLNEKLRQQQDEYYGGVTESSSLDSATA